MYEVTLDNEKFYSHPKLINHTAHFSKRQTCAVQAHGMRPFDAAGTTRAYAVRPYKKNNL